MRSFQTLDTVTIDDETGIIYISKTQDDWMMPRITMRREGNYIAISASYGPMEIAMRLRFDELIRVLSRLNAVNGLQTTRQIGTGQAYIALGLQQSGKIVLRPTIVADATGHLCFNLVITEDVHRQLFEWLQISPKSLR
jgi:hypothetical protein